MDAIKNSLLCNNNEIKACIAFYGFCEEVLYVLAFFKVQQQTICMVANSITCLWADICVRNSERIMKIGQNLQKLCLNEKGPVFMTHSVDLLAQKGCAMFRVCQQLGSTRGQSNLTKSASRGAYSPVRGHPRGSKVVPLNSWGRVSY